MSSATHWKMKVTHSFWRFVESFVNWNESNSFLLEICWNFRQFNLIYTVLKLTKCHLWLVLAKHSTNSFSVVQLNQKWLWVRTRSMLGGEIWILKVLFLPVWFLLLFACKYVWLRIPSFPLFGALNVLCICNTLELWHLTTSSVNLRLRTIRNRMV